MEEFGIGVASMFCEDSAVVEVASEDKVLIFSIIALSGSDMDSVMGRQYIRFAR